MFAKGLSGASVDPFGYAICVILMGLLFAAPLWRMGLVTLADLFRRRYGAGVEWLATLIMQSGGWEALRQAEPMTLTAPGSGWLATLETWSVPVLGSLAAAFGAYLAGAPIGARRSARRRNQQPL